ncbi:MAG: ATP synthase F1 subunit gamma [Bacteroidetes bacterium]|nr:ATP synthase F1 subunit gamma [Bacteroidota bacterium]
MATLRDIKRRIFGVKNTQKITRVMKMIAAAKLRKARTNILNARPYTDKIASIVLKLPAEDDLSSNPFFAQRDVKNVAIVVVTADRGLCGSFNQNIIKETERYINKELKAEDINLQLFCAGKKGVDYFRKRDYEIIGADSGLFSSLEYNSALNIYNTIVPKFLDGAIDKVVLIYNSFVSIINQKLETKQLLPITTESGSEEKYKDDINYIYEPNRGYIFKYIIPKHLKAQLWRTLLESNAAELSSRMTAMDNATTNAEEMIKSLNLTYNKERQAAITKEILEIVSGANALKAS